MLGFSLSSDSDTEVPRESRRVSFGEKMGRGKERNPSIVMKKVDHVGSPLKFIDKKLHIVAYIL